MRYQLCFPSLFCQVLAGVAISPLKKWLFEKAMAWKLSEVRRWVGPVGGAR